MENKLSIHERINFKSYFKPENEDQFFMRINRINFEMDRGIGKTEEPFTIEKNRFLKSLKKGNNLIRKAKY